MNYGIVSEIESISSPVGKAWKAFWRDRKEGKTQKARRFISKEQSEFRRRLHRQSRRDSRHAMREQLKSYRQQTN